jgi:hypothetical protein
MTDDATEPADSESRRTHPLPQSGRGASSAMRVATARAPDPGSQIGQRTAVATAQHIDRSGRIGPVQPLVTVSTTQHGAEPQRADRDHGS